MLGGGDALSLCIGDAQRFLTGSWGQRAHLHRGAEVSAALTVQDVDHVLTAMALRTPAFRLVKGGATLPAATYTRRARIGSRTITDLIDVGRVYDHFADGATIVLQGLHRYWPPVRDLCGQLEAELTHPVQANAYITPPVAQGLRVHADAHDVFALQTYGHKQWVVYDDPNSEPSLDVELQPGDCLYLPTGTRHAARTVDDTSIHLTVGVRTLTWADVLQPILDRAGAEASLEQPLPAGFARNPDVLVAEAGRRLARVAEAVRTADAGAGVQRRADRFWAGRTTPLTGQLQQLLRLDEVTDATKVRRRPDTHCELSRLDEMVHLQLHDRILRMPSSADPALQTALAREAFTVADLRDYLDQPGRITLVRRLVREGVLMVVDG